MQGSDKVIISIKVESQHLLFRSPSFAIFIYFLNLAYSNHINSLSCQRLSRIENKCSKYVKNRSCKDRTQPHSVLHIPDTYVFYRKFGKLSFRAKEERYYFICLKSWSNTRHLWFLALITFTYSFEFDSSWVIVVIGMIELLKEIAKKSSKELNLTHLYRVGRREYFIWQDLAQKTGNYYAYLYYHCANWILKSYCSHHVFRDI